jgi:multiple sugar transport system permease protein
MAINSRRVVLYVAAFLIIIYTLTPIYSVFMIALMDVKDIMGGQVYPVNPSLNQYIRLFGYDVKGHYGLLKGYGSAAQLKQGLTNILIVSPIVTIITMCACIPAGYAIGRLQIRGKRALIGMLLGSRSIPSVSVLIPYYFLFTAIGLRGTLMGIVIIHLSITVPLVTWILMGYFGALPRTLEKAARLDGCSRMGAMRTVVLPVAGPGIAATAIIAFLFSWNDFIFSFLLSGGTSAQTYNAYLTSFFGFTSNEPALFAAAVTIQMVVALMVCIILQRYITSLNFIDPVSVVL